MMSFSGPKIISAMTPNSPSSNSPRLNMSN
jgi:hypothetical protein